MVKFLGDAVRVMLNINTIWGLMILIAFAFCVVQHYVPTSTSFDLQDVPAGKLKIAVQPANAEAGDTKSYTLVSGEWDGATFFPVEEPKDPTTIVQQAELRPSEDGHMLVWDVKEGGEYTLIVNGNPVPMKKPLKLVKLNTFTNAAFGFAKSAFNIALGLVATFVLMLGLMKVGEEAGIVQIVARVLHPIIRFLFPDVPKNHPANDAILMNITTSVLGLGNAATPFGLKAMNELQKLNPYKDVASNSQIMLLGYNTAGFALVPTTLIAVRQSAGASNPFEVIGTCMVAGLVATVTAIVMVKILGALPFFSAQAAAAESTASEATEMVENEEN